MSRESSLTQSGHSARQALTAYTQSWAVFVNGQRHHEIFVTRAAAKREAKRQKETNKIGNES
jgi:hypothetical protein